MSVIQGSILRVVASLVFPDNVIMQNVFHLTLESLVGDGDDDEIVEDMVGYIEAIYSELSNAISDAVSTGGIIVYKWDAVGEDFDEVGQDVWAFDNNNLDDLLPHGVAAVVNFQTVDPDVQGRKYFGGMCENLQDASTWEVNTITALGMAGIEIAQAYIDGVSSNEYDPGVWSPTEEDIYSYGPALFVKHIAGYQRRRKPGVGI